MNRTLQSLLGMLVLAQIAYPLTTGPARAGLAVATVAVGFALSVTHAGLTRGGRTAAVLVLVTTLGGFVVEAVGVNTGLPFGRYGYGSALGPQLLGVPVVIALAWTWMAWPAWIAAGHLVGHPALRTLTAAVGLAAWDLFLDPQMVAEGYWSWDAPTPALPGVPGVPVGNYLGWLVVAALMTAVLMATVDGTRTSSDAPMLSLYLWTYGSSVLAHAVFLDLPGSALWGGVGMGVVAVPLAWRLLRSRTRSRVRL